MGATDSKIDPKHDPKHWKEEFKDKSKTEIYEQIAMMKMITKVHGPDKVPRQMFGAMYEALSHLMLKRQKQELCQLKKEEEQTEQTEQTEQE